MKAPTLDFAEIPDFQAMKILVLGANGQVGSELGEQLDNVSRLKENCSTLILRHVPTLILPIFKR